MIDAISTTGLTKRYGRRTALDDCTLSVPTGRVVGLVGPNGAGKSTLLQLACGLLRPTAGTIDVLGGRPGSGPAQSARVGFVAQDTPTYAHLTIAEHLRMGRALNHGWDDAVARERITRLGLDPKQRAGRLSGGQRSQLALTLAVAKRPDLLLLDEPVAALDPLARREFLQSLMEHTAEHGTSLVLSSHLVGDLERTCDYLIVLVSSHIRLAGDVDELLAQHHRLTGARREASSLPAGHDVIYQSHAGKQSTMIVRSSAPIDDPWWTVEPLSLEDVVLAYMTEAGRITPAPVLEGQR
jgi:ABC-2 type transport system ATP-binding protein